MTLRTYSELITLKTFQERYRYLSLKARVGEDTFGFERYINQAFYTSKEWRDIRHFVIARDEGRDLGVDGYEIAERPLIHHIIPMTVKHLEAGDPLCLDPENLITTTHNTHNAIHFGDESLLRLDYSPRTAGDTRLW